MQSKISGRIGYIQEILVIAGGVYNKTEHYNRIIVPLQEYKIIYSVTHQKVLYCLLFENKEKASCKDITQQELEALIGRKILLKY